MAFFLRYVDFKDKILICQDMLLFYHNCFPMKPNLSKLAILSLVGNMRIFDDFKFGLALLDKAGTSGNHTRTIVQKKLY